MLDKGSPIPILSWEILVRAAQIRQNSKCDILEQLMSTLEDKVIIFTEYRLPKTTSVTAWAGGLFTVGFDERLSGQERMDQTAVYRNAQVMVSTESGGEGLNLQFCNTIINFDLPWNPMRWSSASAECTAWVMRDVHIYNLVTENTIEEHIMYLLHKKINLFEEIIGELMPSCSTSTWRRALKAN